MGEATRSDDEIREDLIRWQDTALHAWQRDEALDRVVADVEPLLRRLAVAEARIDAVTALADRTLTFGGPEIDAWVNLSGLRRALASPVTVEDGPLVDSDSLPVPVVECPSCGASIRARMPEHPEGNENNA